MVFLGLNYILCRHILGHREQQSIENISKSIKETPLWQLYSHFERSQCPHRKCAIRRADQIKSVLGLTMYFQTAAGLTAVLNRQKLNIQL